jgi:NhaC family Na+:H+ antiporter
MPPLLAILGSALFAGILACFTQWTVVKAFVDEPGLGPVATGIKAIYAAMATGFVSKSGNPAIDQLFSRGAMLGIGNSISQLLTGQTVSGVDAGFDTSLTAMAIAYGLMVSAVSLPRRSPS